MSRLITGAELDLVIQTKKKTTQKRTKSHGGCKTCKTRRVKCDESKPVCLRCARGNYVCDGYPRSKDKSQPPKALLPKSHEQSNIIIRNPTLPLPRNAPRTPSIIIQPSARSGFAEMDYPYLDLFRVKAAPELAGYFESDIWNCIILQACHDEEYVRHAIVALGALHKSLEVAQDRRNGLTEEDGKVHYQFALQKYAKALRLMGAIAQYEDKSKVRNTLMSSLLTTCFESYMGNQERAVRQAQAGLGVLAKWKEECRGRGEDPSIIKQCATSHSQDNELLRAFAHVDFQVVMFKDSDDCEAENDLLEIPHIFTSAEEARYYWELIIQQALRRSSPSPSGCVEKFASMNFGGNKVRPSLRTGGMFALAQKVREGLGKCEDLTKRWFEAFKPIFNRTRHQPGTRDFLGANLVMIRYLPAHPALIRRGKSSGQSVDALPSEYTNAVAFAQELMGYNIVPGKVAFIFDLCLVVSLLIIAGHGRDGIVRRQAIALLLMQPRREGLFDCRMGATVVTWLMDEEEKLVDGRVPESAKVKIVSNDFVLAERKAVIRATKDIVLDGKEERIILAEVTVRW